MKKLQDLFNRAKISEMLLMLSSNTNQILKKLYIETVELYCF